MEIDSPALARRPRHSQPSSAGKRWMGSCPCTSRVLGDEEWGSGKEGKSQNVRGVHRGDKKIDTVTPWAVSTCLQHTTVLNGLYWRRMREQPGFAHKSGSQPCSTKPSPAPTSLGPALHWESPGIMTGREEGRVSNQEGKCLWHELLRMYPT